MNTQISQFIKSQIPEFYLEYGPNLVEFIETYYEWMETPGNPIYQSRTTLDSWDIDRTTTAFIQYFKNTYINSLPESILADKKLLIKHIQDLYNAKGSDRGYKLLFRMLFNEDIDIYRPGDHMFALSSGEWTIPQYLEVSDSQYLSQMVGNQIVGTRNGSTAIVDDYYIKTLNDKVVNVLVISGVNGVFSYGEKILCTQIPAITIANAPLVFGSLSSISITNGGYNFNVGDTLDVSGTGMGAKARVVATTAENGRVTFHLVNGGFGFSKTPQIVVSGGGGSGATFQVGGLANQHSFSINTDIINNYYNTVLDSPAAGYQINYTANTGAFLVGQQVVTSNNYVVELDVTYISGTANSSESLSNTTLNINNLSILSSQGNYIMTTGNSFNVTSANLVTGAVLVSNTSGAVLKVNSVMPYQIVTGNASIVSVNTTAIMVNNTNGYFIRGCNVSVNSTIYATATSVFRETNWNFPAINFPDIENLDTTFVNALTTTLMTVGTITSLVGINPGIGYSTNPTVTISEPNIIGLQIPDGAGGVWGSDAIVTGTASQAQGIVTAIKMVDSGFAYVPNEVIQLSSNSNPAVVDGVAIVDQHGHTEGFWKNSPDDARILQDSRYYQVFSLEIVASKMFESYQQLMKDLVHPAGIALYGRFIYKDSMDDTSQLMTNTMTSQVTYPALLSVNLLTSTALPSWISFSRAGQATMFDTHGYLTYAPNNLCVYSNDLTINTSWLVHMGDNGATTSAKNAGPDPFGGNTACSLTNSGAQTNPIYGLWQAIGAPYQKLVVSVWLKSGTTTSANFAATGYGSDTILAGGPLTLTNTWQRYSFTVTGDSQGIRVSIATNATAGTIYTYGFQVEAVTYQTTPSTYNATTSSAYYAPRFDYDPVTKLPKGLLIENSSTNLATYSQNTAQSGPWYYNWNGTASTLTQNFFMAPDGTMTAVKIVNNAVNEGIYQRITTLPTANAYYTFSIWLYAPSATTLNYQVLATGGTAWQSGTGLQTVNLAAGVWTRVSVTAQAAASVTATSVTFDIVSPTTGNTFSVWGLQYEQGATASSYIPTVAASVTRPADVPVANVGNGLSKYGYSLGVQFLAPAVTGGGLGLLTGRTAANADAGGIWLTSNTTYTPFMDTPTQTNGSITNAVAVGSKANIVVAWNGWSTPTMHYSLNGSAVGVTNATGTLNVPTTVQIGNYSSASQVNSWIQSISIWDYVLPDTIIQQNSGTYN